MKQVFIVIFSGIASLVSLGMIVLTFDPIQGGGSIKFLFYASLFVVIWSMGTTLFIYLRRGGENGFTGAFKGGLLLSGTILAIFLGLRLK